MSELYTRTIFYEFQDEVCQKDAYMLTRTFKDDRLCLYSVQRGESASRGRELTFDKSSNLLTCSCKMFECDGTPCKHMLQYFSKKQLQKLPEQYILPRWIKSVKAERVFDDLGGGMTETCDSSMLDTRNSLSQLSSSVIDEALVIEGGSDVVKDCLLIARKKLRLMKSGHEDGEGSTIQMSIETPIAHASEVRLKESIPARTKGCGKRLKRGKEKAMVKKGRRCNGCGKIGVSHDKRNCPVLLKLSQGEQLNDEDEDEVDDDGDVEVDSGSGN